MEQRLVYFDHNATTPVSPEVLVAALPFLREEWGNPSSAYLFGHRLTEHIDGARRQVASLINAEPREIVFTSCGTESINAAIHSALCTQKGKRHVVTTAVEHSATLKYCEFLRKHGAEITYLPVDAQGQLDLASLQVALRDDTALVSIIWGNNETGVLLPVKEIAGICRANGVLCHVDAVQVAGKLPIDVKDVGVDLLSLSAHKLYAPKGIGALFTRRDIRFQPYILGGSQERNRRAGTENVAGIVAFGCAAEAAMQNSARMRNVRDLRDRLEEGILGRIAGTLRNGAEPRLPNTSNLAFDGVEAEAILMLLDQAGVCASSGSACTTGSLEPSHVLVAMGCSAERARNSVRFSLGIRNTEEEVDYVIEQMVGIVEKMRSVTMG